MDILKTQKQNETLINELNQLEAKIRKKIVSHDQSEFAEENVQYVPFACFSLRQRNISIGCLDKFWSC